MAGATPRAVLARLRQPGDTYGVAIPPGGAAWDPSKPLGPEGMIFGRAVARYWLDDHSLVHLWYSPQEGPDRNVSGPRPELPPANPAVRWILRGYLIATAIVFGLTASLVRADLGLRLAAGMAAVMALWVVVGRAGMVVQVYRGLAPVAGPEPASSPDPPVVADPAPAPTHAPTYQDLLRVNAAELLDYRQQMFKSVATFGGGVVLLSLPWEFTALLGFVAILSSMVWFGIASHGIAHTRRSIERQALDSSARLVS